MGNTVGPFWSYLEHGLVADRPSANADTVGKLYRSTDESPNRTYLCVPSGTSQAWVRLPDLSGGGFRQLVTFSVTNVAAGDNATVASSTPVAAQFAGAAAVTVGFVPMRPGSLVGLSAALSSAAAGSNLIAGVYKNGTIMNAATIVTLASATSDTKASATFTPGTYTFAAGDVIDVKIRTGSGWSATTADLGVSVQIEE